MENFAYKTISQSWMSLNILVKRVNTRQVFARAVLPVEVLPVSVDVEKFINTIFWSKAKMNLPILAHILGTSFCTWTRPREFWKRLVCKTFSLKNSKDPWRIKKAYRSKQCFVIFMENLNRRSAWRHKYFIFSGRGLLEGLNDKKWPRGKNGIIQ